ncbi:efflux RND transporter periplasmic adaptor subunit [Ferrimonas lipolytica]|uniref:Efflux RND transporter periplasmic adaptor subunit n=1 Tax=Ferrimonas lipolytica TaxID=2724191 RepID=A0A6H1UAZ1_9GAMM|nr:efflux RND transporter periplasmic adaptor subunit [Ferrimonas lipolytica]QIZ75750.1 efflux RND transporter periplasmic adaptor subunit [Ferrimonas lipolytica]
MKNLKLAPVAAVVMALYAPMAISGDDHAHENEPLELNQPISFDSHEDHQHEQLVAHEDEDHQAHDEQVEAALHVDEHEDGDDDDHADEADDDHGHDEEEEEGLKLSPAQSAIAGIEVASVHPSQFDMRQRTPAQLLADPNLTRQVALPVSVRVVARHITPGQQVHTGDKLYTIASSEIANAQGKYLLAQAEWKRVVSLGKKAVSAARYQQARIDIETSIQDLLAIGMTQQQIDGLTRSDHKLGQFELLAGQSGTLQQDNAVVGQFIDASTPLALIADESALWVSAQIRPKQVGQVQLGQEVTVQVDNLFYQAKVIGRDHQLDPQTRTETIRLAIDNSEHRLHAGEYATVFFSQSKRSGIVLPDSALARGADGDWMVYLYDGDAYSGVEVTVLASQQGFNLISGIEAGSKVAITGAFFLASEQAKSGFDIHNH